MENTKIFLELDNQGYILSIAESEFESFIETEYSPDTFHKEFGAKVITDGRHRYENGKIILTEGSVESLARHRKSEENQLRSCREKECFPIINRGKIWYDLLSDVQLNELRTWYNAWLDVTITLVRPKMPKWLKPKEEDKQCIQE